MRRAALFLALGACAACTVAGAKLPAREQVAELMPSDEIRVMAASGDALIWLDGSGALKTVSPGQAPSDLIFGSIGNDNAVPFDFQLGDQKIFFSLDTPIGGERWIGAAPRTGGSTEAIARRVDPLALAADADQIYWLDAKGGLMTSSDSAGPARLADTSGPPVPRSLRLDAGNFYWAETGGGGDESSHIMALSRSSTTGLAIEAAATPALIDLAIAPGTLLFASASAISRLDLAAGTSTPIIEEPKGMVRIAATGTAVYYATAKAIFRLRNSQTVPEQLADGDTITDFAIAQTGLYWYDRGPPNPDGSYDHPVIRRTVR